MVLNMVSSTTIELENMLKELEIFHVFLTGTGVITI